MYSAQSLVEHSINEIYSYYYYKRKKKLICLATTLQSQNKQCYLITAKETRYYLLLGAGRRDIEL